MVKFTKKGMLVLAAGLFLIFGFASAYEDFGLPELFVTALFIAVIALGRRMMAKNNSLSSIQFTPGSEEDEEFGDTLSELLNDLEEFEREHMGWHGVHISRTNSWIHSYFIQSLDGENFTFYSVIPKDKESGLHIHIVVEVNTGIIVQHGPVNFEREYAWPFDYCSAVESLREAQQRRSSSSIRETLQAMGQGQLEGDYSDLVLDKDIQDQDAVLNVGGGGRGR